ncbi:F0F1 ATP synthase subunit delta [Billgrantia tianxiuensis]|jgi:F-type H+-transporting ATPase subunit delta|uniref:ATP synthase subunit delta n=1 Tax=Billgrantia tianxiuensis TaxID=2497861 RepID=A0A6I6SMT3_9GAMM|nr:MULTISPECIES: F0F1 ATP synthase subunit delta [Halomonas]MCE8035246.1 F0F1 ATP synthase subunit delta [Halomonas sp. MCCC 1A11057]QHC51939.1 F0F1 ATP synthase subunit delta [Halomonas tianxiuensis]
MAELSTVARPYARAAFEFARDHQALESWSDWLGKLGAVVAVRDVQKLLASPSLTTERKVELIVELAEVELDEASRRFLDTLGESGRLATLSAIAEHFEQLRAEHEKRIEVVVVSAYELDDKQQNKLAGALKKRLNREISITTQVDPKLIGGAILRAGDTVIDGSVRGRLNRLSEALTA